MALSDNYKLDTASASTFGGTTIEAIIDWNCTETGSSVDINHDGKPIIQGVVTDNIAMDVSITTQDSLQGLTSGFSVGTHGALVLKCIARGPGKTTTGTVKTVTMTNAVVTSVNPMVGHEGTSSLSLNFRVYDNGSNALYAVT